MIRGIDTEFLKVGKLLVINKTGSGIAAKTLLYVNGYDKTSEKPTVALADADAGLPATFITKKAIANNAIGEVYNCAEIEGLNTSGASAVGSPIYLSATDGGWAVTAPTGINQLVQKVGFVTVKHASTGKIIFLLGIIDELNGKVIGTFGVQDGSITNAKMATDVKVGSLAALTTTEKASLVGAINEIKALIGSGSITSITGFTKMYAKKALQLNAHGTTPVKFMTADAATLNGEAGPFDCSGVGNGGTIKLTVDEELEDTATLNATAGKHESGLNPSIDISGGVDNKFNIQADGDATPHLITLTLAGLNSGAGIASAMQTAIRALGGIYAAITVAYSGSPVTDKYTFTSHDLGTGSNIIITDAVSGNIAEELKIGTANGGTSTPGTGDCASIHAVTRGEIATLIDGDIEGVSVGSASVVTVTSDTTGKNSRLVAGNGTLNTIIGLANLTEDNGAQGLGFASNMSDANYIVLATLNGSADPTNKGVSVNNRAAAGFDLVSDGATDADYVDILVLGV